MSKIFITGSSDGLGKLAAEKLITQGHEVFLHARNEARATATLEKIRGSKGICIADLAEMDQVKSLANQVNELGKMDTIIHNAGVYHAEAPSLFQINVLAPYVLTALIEMPEHLIYLSSGMHKGGKPVFKPESLNQLTYSDSKLMLTTLMRIVADKFPNSYVNAVDPGWVPTKMGGANAPEDLDAGAETQVWLAGIDSPSTKVSGEYFKHKRIRQSHEVVKDSIYQKNLIHLLQDMSGIVL
ncbi:SDR family NAD(P)-dependent oxidoreductase [Algoriphagus namhaensis]|uniref:SDR family NAD(P)-dependent oxidoreductase n=1 Tax=Algoriphagus namhaensis TaxID=915353 RepID=A0ABV8ATQ5_9BACT